LHCFPLLWLAANFNNAILACYSRTLPHPRAEVDEGKNITFRPSVTGIDDDSVTMLISEQSQRPKCTPHPYWLHAGREFAAVCFRVMNFGEPDEITASITLQASNEGMQRRLTR